MAVVLIVWFGCTGKQARDEARVAARHAERVAELRGTIAYLDESMSMSARLSAASGENRWTQRYEEAAPRLAVAIEEAEKLASPEGRAAFASTVGEAHRDLVTMERSALSLVTAGQTAAARALLDGPDFAYLKEVYASGMEEFGQDLASSSNARTDILTDRAWLQALGLALAVVGLVATGLSVSGRARHKNALSRVAAIARTDALTDLPNRRRFYEVVESLLAGPWAQGHILLLIDLDRFKAINDAHGHPVGDEVLKLAAARLRSIVREDDLVARLGGDEFAVVLRHDHGSARPRREADAVACRILATLAEPFIIGDDTRVQIGASAGIASPDAECTVVIDLMRRADVALSRAKVEGRNCFRAFEPGMDAQVRSRALLERDLRQAIEEDAIVPYFQPLVDLQSGSVVGVEMLARWFHPIRGMVPPDTFIPIAEELGLITLLTKRLLLRGCIEAADWRRDVTLACNLSPVQLSDPGLPGAICDIITATAFQPERLVLEITESALVGDLDLARTSLLQLKALGVRLALDDFGTGYSSLRHLQTLPFDKIKIDKSFVAAMADDAESGKIVSAVVALGQSLGLITVAEGIETEDIAVRLRTLGCDIGQGWLYGRPAPAHHLEDVLGDVKVLIHPEPVAA